MNEVRSGTLSLIEEFDLDFSVKSQGFSAAVYDIAKESVRTMESCRRLDYFSFWNKIKAERENARFDEGLGIFIDFPELDVEKFVDTGPIVENPSDYETAPWGMSEYTKGLMLLSNPQATRHECGHLFGLEHHCSKVCVMRGKDIPTERFCEDCKHSLRGFLSDM